MKTFKKEWVEEILWSTKVKRNIPPLVRRSKIFSAVVDESLSKLVASKYVIVVIVFVALLPSYLPQPDPVFRSPEEGNFCFGNL